MDRELQGKATLEIMKSCDVIIASGESGIAGKVGRELGGALHSMGVKSAEAKILFEMVENRIFDDTEDEADEESDGE